MNGWVDEQMDGWMDKIVNMIKDWKGVAYLEGSNKMRSCSCK